MTYRTVSDLVEYQISPPLAVLEAELGWEMRIDYVSYQK